VPLVSNRCCLPPVHRLSGLQRSTRLSISPEQSIVSTVMMTTTTMMMMMNLCPRARAHSTRGAGENRREAKARNNPKAVLRYSSDKLSGTLTQVECSTTFRLAPSSAQRDERFSQHSLTVSHLLFRAFPSGAVYSSSSHTSCRVVSCRAVAVRRWPLNATSHALRRSCRR